MRRVSLKAPLHAPQRVQVHPVHRHTCFAGSLLFGFRPVGLTWAQMAAFALVIVIFVFVVACGCCLALEFDEVVDAEDGHGSLSGELDALDLALCGL